MKAYKIVNEVDGHRGLFYHKGYNEDPRPFNPSGDCEPGGIYYAREDTLAFLGYGNAVYRVTPVGEEYANPIPPRKYKAHAVILERVGEVSDLAVIRLVLAEGANVHAGNDRALMWAATNGHTDVARLLLDAGMDAQACNGALLRAAENGRAAIVRLLLDAGADVHVYSDAPLQWAAENGRVEVMRLLLEAGADVHADNNYALRLAVHQGHAECVRLLLDAGADVRACRNEALMAAAENGHAECVRLLLAAGADVHAGDDAALRLAAKRAHTECVRLLVEAGAGTESEPFTVVVGTPYDGAIGTNY